jgi:hypothetical protein
MNPQWQVITMHRAGLVIESYVGRWDASRKRAPERPRFRYGPACLLHWLKSVYL